MGLVEELGVKVLREFVYSLYASFAILFFNEVIYIKGVVHDQVGVNLGLLELHVLLSSVQLFLYFPFPFLQGQELLFLFLQQLFLLLHEPLQVTDLALLNLVPLRVLFCLGILCQLFVLLLKLLHSVLHALDVQLQLLLNLS